jgi:hypothetical protein
MAQRAPDGEPPRKKQRLLVQLGLGAFSFTRGNAPAGVRDVAPPPGFPCSNCPRSFKTSAALTIHVGLKHPEQPLRPPALALEATAIYSLFDTPFFASIRAAAPTASAEAPAPSAAPAASDAAIDAMVLDEPAQEDGREKKQRHRYTLKQKVKMLEKVDETAKVIAASRSIPLGDLPAKMVANAVEKATGVSSINIFKWLKKRAELETRYVTLRNRLKKAFGGGRPPLFPKVLRSISWITSFIYCTRLALSVTQLGPSLSFTSS